MSKEPTLQDDLRAAYEAAELGGLGEDLEEALAEGDAATDDQAGATKVADDATAVAAEDAAAGDDAPAVQDQAAAAGSAGTAGAPEHWSADDKAFFAGLPDDAARARVLDWRKSIERGAKEKFEAAAEARRDLGEIDRLLQPIAADLRAAGATRIDAVRALMAAETRLRTDPLGGLSQLVETYGRSVAGTVQARELIRHLAKALKVGDGAPEQKVQAETQDPVMARVTALESELARERRERADAEARRQQEALRSADDAISVFAAEKTAEGQPAHPHFEQVRSLMGALLHEAAAAGKPMTLKEAYQSAVWARPDLRDELVKAHAAADAKLAAERDQAALERARRARTPRTASAAVTEPEEDLPVAELLRREIERGAPGRV